MGRLLALAPRLLGFLPLLLLAVDALARGGGGEGYSGGSGGSYGGGYGGGGFGLSGSGSGRGGDAFVFDLLLLWVDLSLRQPLIGIPVNAFILYIAYQCLNARYEARRDACISSGLEKQSELRLRTETAQLKARDPGFDERRFLERAGAAFLRVQQAWTAGDMGPARGFVSDGVHERFSRQLRDLRERGLTNVMKDVKVLDCAVLGCVSDPHFDALHVGLRAHALDRTVDAKGDFVSVHDGEFEEVWTFLRRPGAKTLRAGGAIEGRCPSCGSPLQVADAGSCGACKTFVNSGEHDWVLAEITQRSEWSAHDAERDADGWREFAEADPALNAHAVEDRASLMFWRWLDALRRGEPSPLLPVASPRCAAALLEEANGARWRDAAVGAVDLIACERAGAQDRLHVQVKWEAAPVQRDGPVERVGTRLQQRHFFVLERAAGAKTDARGGLRTLRCPSCGAPPAEKDQAACAYCAKPFNDGTRDWILVEVVPFGRWKRPSASNVPAPPPMPGLDWDQGVAPAEAAAVLARAMFADGEVSPHEHRFLLEYGRARGLDGERVAQIVASAQGGLLDAPRPADGGQAEAMLRGLIRMSLADGRVTDGENAALAAFGRRFGLHHNDVKQMVDEERGALYSRLTKGTGT